MRDLSPLFQRTITLINAIPKGKVVTYGRIAQLILAPGCARHVSYILSSSSRKYDLPWQRVIGAQGKISLPVHNGYFRQKKLLESEGVVFDNEKVDLSLYMWDPSVKSVNQLLKGLPLHSPKRK